ncbi:MAG: SUMF1/EgtB/PvdO family nonheme iron enzyme [Bryobacterales bacterium]|nr:SUMF1/EgtB/PvdO family nonheme iron enzyme [Bryobacterales bacterium]
MLRRHFLSGSVAGPLCHRVALGDSIYRNEWFQAGIIPAPAGSAAWPAHREALIAWRRDARRRLKYDGSLHGKPEFAWVQSSFACCFLMMCDEMFHDHREGRYEVDRWVDEGIREFGGYDSVVLWHAYPRIGLDQRNQFDFYRDMPGGLAGLRKVAEAFQARGVRVYIDYNPWDTGTRREPLSDMDTIASVVEAIGADGVFLDTMNRGGPEFRAKLDAVRRGVVLESENTLPLENVHDHHMSWAQGFEDSGVPGVLRNKWFERRHMQHQIRRWNHDHTGELQAAWMNGSGMMVWENVFGSWVGWSPRDRSILRSMLPIQRRYSALFAGEGWTPLVPTGMPDVHAGLWEGDGLRLWTLVNRSHEPREGMALRVSGGAGIRCFDLIRGREVKAGALTASIRPRGIAAFLAAPGTPGGDFERFLSEQAMLDARADFRAESPTREALLRAAAPGRFRGSVPAEMAEVRGATYEMVVEYRIRETGFYTGREYIPDHGYRLPSGQAMSRLGRVARTVTLKRYAIDLTPVTNAQFKDFLARSAYRPKHPENFLKHWREGAVPPGMEEHPVVWVDLDDARAYAAWAGKRLPTEEEWQYAAQGPDGLRYPWGNEIRPGVMNSGETGGLTPVKAFPAGRSPFGCYDMCGNAWEWTESERSDGRTRFAMIRGGSYFQAKGSSWYMDGGPQPCNFAAKFLLMWPGLDRCSTIGFRCAAGIEG